jgi:PKHD-type hydroxylase|tara:strand:+ start:2514 stop:3122 length:609 start_codon:yes stop_codon:yes gene_type:complete
MANTIVWYYTGLPDIIIDQVISDCKYHMNPLEQSKVGMVDKVAPNNIRKSEVSWIPSTTWIGGFIYSYVLKANRENFKYDIEEIESDAIQYTHYGLDGHYRWHTDTALEMYSQTTGNIGNDFMSENCEKSRKLSFSFQLSDPYDYEGGNFEIQSDDSFKKIIAPRTKGTLFIFDSRYRHRVTKITKGQREALVGWVSGPRWR